MSDIVVRLPVRPGREAQLFGDYLAGFVDRLSKEVEAWSEGEAPWLMVHSDPSRDIEVKVLTFQRASAANDFSTGWAQALRGLASG